MKKRYKVISFYCFTSIKKSSLLNFKEDLLRFGDENIYGLLILGEEGINGTICGLEENVKLFIMFINQFLNNKDLNIKISFSEKIVFRKLKVKIKEEIVTMGLKDIDPNKLKGTYINSTKWNQLIKDKNTIIIDTRNHYEIALGTFKNALNPNTNNFREFPKWVEDNLEKFIQDKENCNIAMFCTGGIRCEKATSLILRRGYKNVFHLQGGILKYLETIEKDQNLYKGECYVFDERVALDNKLDKGSYSICHACGMPVSEQDKSRDEYIKGIQCHLCIEKFSDKDRERFAERQKQIDKKEKVS